MKLFDKLKQYKVILASQSPRRKQLLEGLGIQFDVMPLHTNEHFPEKLRREEIALFLAKSKAEEAKKLIKDNELIITADTIVWLQHEVMNKASDYAEAQKMLMKLSDKTHEVITAVSLTSAKKSLNFYVVTEVKFKQLLPDEIDFYINEYKPFDKAGAYGIQEWIGYVGVESINGSFYNVMGLPTMELVKELNAF